MGKTGSYEESSYKVIKLKCQGGNENEKKYITSLIC
jgi:hypothetical protein